MSEIKLSDDKVIGDYRKPYIVAEVNSSHNGNIERAKKMIDAAKKVNCDCVKFQSWSQNSLYSRTFYDANPIAKRIIGKFALSKEELLDIAMYCESQNIAFSSTPYAEDEVDFLIEKCHVPYIKIASMEINNYSFLEYIARTGVPIILSTGMADMDEISKAIEHIEKVGNTTICLLHCISIYPPNLADIRLQNIMGLREKFPMYPIGFSDHSLGIEMSGAAVALGAAVIEKHFTLDKTKMGMDNNMAIEASEMMQLVKNCHNIQVALGGKDRIVLEEELEQRKKMRRSIVAGRDMKAGTILKSSDFIFKRPGTGMEPKLVDNLIGRKLCKDVEYDTVMKWEDMTNQ